MALELPSSFALKSHQNSKYVAYVKEGEVQGLLKSSAEDVNPSTVFEVEKANTGDGLVHLKSSYNDKYLRRWDRSNWWIAAVADEPEEDQSKWSCTLFKPIFVEDGGGDGSKITNIQLIHVQLGHYVRPWTMYEPYELCLFAAEKGPDKEKQDVFTVSTLPGPEEDHTNVDFGLKDDLARIYDQTTLELAIGIANNITDTEQAIQVLLDYDKSESSTWKLSSSNRTSNINSAIPVIINGRIEMSGNVFSGPYEWGTTVETRYSNVKTSYNVVVPPKTRVLVTLKATKASFDAPFTYMNRLEPTQKREDGVFTGVHLYNLRYETEQRKISNV